MRSKVFGKTFWDQVNTEIVVNLKRKLVMINWKALEKKIKDTINWHSVDSLLGIPDLVLANYLVEHLKHYNDGSVVLPLGEYECLFKESEKLTALENAGVDNWEGYGIAMSSLEDPNLRLQLSENYTAVIPHKKANPVFKDQEIGDGTWDCGWEDSRNE